MERTNVAELLKDCPKDMELDCTTFVDNVKFISVEEDDDKPICIKIRGIYYYLTKFGTWTLDENDKCVIFPKGKTTWEGFQRPFKEGDIVINKRNNPFIYKGKNEDYYECYVGLVVGCSSIIVDECSTWMDNSCELRFATEKEKQSFFNAIKKSGYEWDSDSKTLKRLIKFKVGDRIKHKHRKTSNTHTILSMDEDFYYCGLDECEHIWIDDQDDYELVPDTDKFDFDRHYYTEIFSKQGISFLEEGD